MAKHKLNRKTVVVAPTVSSNNPTSASSTPLLSIKLSRNKVSYAKPTELFAAVTFTPPEQAVGTKRAPLAVSLAIDVSGSMDDVCEFAGGRPDTNRSYTYPGTASPYIQSPRQPTKISAVRDTLLKLLDFLQDGDFLAITTFAYSAYTSLPLTKIDGAATRERIESVINSLRADGGTNLNEGLRYALDRVDSSHPFPAGTMRRVLLLTDGQTNQGVVNGRLIRQNMLDHAALGTGLVNTNTGPIAVSTFGFGSVYNADLLASLVHNGATYFLDSTEKVATAFGTELGSAVSLFATDAYLTIDFDTFVAGKIEILNEGLKDLVYEAGKERRFVSMPCPNLLAGQPYSVLFKVTTNKNAPRGIREHFVSADATMNAVALRATITASSDKTVLETTSQRDADKTDDESVTKLVAVQIAAKAQREAMAAASKGDLVSAQTVLRRASLATNSYGNAAMSRVLASQAASSYATMDSYARIGANESASLNVALSGQTGSTGGTIVGDVNIDEQFQRPAAQVATIKQFSIKRAPRKSETP